MSQRPAESSASLVVHPDPAAANSEPQQRTIYINNEEANHPFRFASNVVTTAKYNILTFLPKNLFEQFCRLANIYFLIISAFQQIPGVSPTGRWTTLGPLAFVLAVTALKEAYEDIKRHQQDNLVNNSETEVLRDGVFVRTLWKHVKTGDIVRVHNKQFIPADLILLASSEPQGMCYIETASLDGETNLKIRQALEETTLLETPESLKNFKGTINCELPNNRLYNFDGTITFHNRTHPLGVKQVLLRGAALRNTKWVNGIAVFTGKETKLVKNSSPTPAKRSNVERVTNYQIILIFAFELVLCTMSAIGCGVWTGDHHDDWYLQFTRTSAVEGAWSWITFLILFNNLIPISLYVSMEAVKVVQAFLISNDIEMYYGKNDTPASARTSNLNEELGQVQYIFSDKTGTLTQNLMQFRKCSIAGIVYGGADGVATEPKEDIHVNCNDDRVLQNLQSGHSTAEVIREFLTLLSVCHTVIPEKEDGELIYQAASPDENALVSAAKHFSFEFHTRTPKTVTVSVLGKDLTYEVLNVLEFNSTRKRMSVIVRNPEGKILLYTKGADTVIYERLSTDQPYGDITISHLQEFASEGLRTLCLAVAELDPVEYEEWNKIFYAASTTIINREAELDKAAELVEKNLFLLGATAIEDKLQEGVPETIQVLATAGIKIWVLTGDKQETAINIGFSCQLLTEAMELIVINEETEQAAQAEIASRMNKLLQAGDSVGELALIIDGHTLRYALQDNLKMQLLELAKKCKAVVCCRVSPLQKAQVVKLVRDNLDAITLAIGDGANDVSMIQAAHVGIGISGEEGLQAARASDYSIAQFRFLQRLLLIHGRNSYRRITKLILYCFYRNIALYITQFWFAIMDGWSGQTFYERFTLTAYNILWTFFPVLMLGIFDKDVDDKMVYEHPQLYQTGHRKYHFNYKVFWGWVANAIWQSLVLYGFVALTFKHANTFESGRAIDLFAMGTVSYTCVVLTVNLKLALEIRYWTWANHVFLWGSIVAYALWLLIYGVFFDSPSVDVGADIYYVIFHLATTPLFWFSIIIVPVICLWRDISWKYVMRTHLPVSYHIIQEIEMLESATKTKEFKNSNKNNKRPYTGYSFSQADGEGETMQRRYSTRLA